jgi:hypothetical protein
MHVNDSICSHTVWPLMGSLVAIITATAGTVIAVQLIIIYALWKRYSATEQESKTLIFPFKQIYYPRSSQMLLF